MGSIGVTGTTAANTLAAEADVVLAVGTRLQDFTTGSRALFRAPGRRFVSLNVQAFDAGKHGAQPLVARRQSGVGGAGRGAVATGARPRPGSNARASRRQRWQQAASGFTVRRNAELADGRSGDRRGAAASLPSDIMVCAAGGLPGELHKHWQAVQAAGYHVEYGFSCMGYEIAGALGVKLARPFRDVFVLVGDGSYLMMNSEIATSVMLGLKLTIVVLDNRGYGCINRLQIATGGESFNNLLRDTVHETLPQIDFAAHARSLGAVSEKVDGLGGLEAALARARLAERTSVVVIDTDPLAATDAGGSWWDVAVPEVSDRAEVREARTRYEVVRRERDA